MKTIRKGNDIVVRWRIFRYGQEYDIALYRESISLILSNMGEKKEITDYSIVDVNTIVFKYRAEDQGLGIYRLLLIDKSRNSTRIIEECNAFRLVNTSDAANNDGTLESAITITLTSELTAPADGLSAYEVALQNGFIGTEEEWLQSLKGEQGPQGIQGDKGDKGDRGEQGEKGLSAYQVAIANGFVGTEAEWLQSLVPDTTDIELAEAQRQAKELERIDAENARQSAELERQNASAEAVSSANEAASNANEAAITAQQKAAEANAAASAANAAASSANAVVEGFNSIIVQETGNSQDKVMSQKAVTDAMIASQEKLSELSQELLELKERVAALESGGSVPGETKYTISASAENGSVVASVNGVSVDLPYKASKNEVVKLEVLADSGYQFAQWSDGITENPREIEVVADVVYSAVCEISAKTYTLRATADNGSIVAKVNGSAVTLPYTAPVNTEVELDVQPIEGYEFTEWSNASNDNPRIVRMTTDKRMNASCELAGNIPADYRILRGIYSDANNSYLDTGAAIDSHSNWDLYFGRTKYINNNNVLFGIRRASGTSDARANAFYHKSASSWSQVAWVYGGTDKGIINASGWGVKFFGNKHKLSQRGNDLYEWDRLICHIEKAFNNEDGVTAFFGNLAKAKNTPYSTAVSGTAIFYRFVLYGENETIVKDLRPVKRVEDGVFGAYDIISGEFIPCVGTWSEWSQDSASLRIIGQVNHSPSITSTSTQSASYYMGYFVTTQDGQGDFIVQGGEITTDGTTINNPARQLLHCNEYNNNWHGNTAWFGADKWDASDYFPLLYVGTDKGAQLLCVYRLIGANPDALEGVELVQKIYTPRDTPWYFNNYYGMAGANTFVHTGYTQNSYSLPDNGNTIMARVFRLPDPTIGDVTLSETDALVEVDLGFQSTTGDGYWTGKYLAITFSNPNANPKVDKFVIWEINNSNDTPITPAYVIDGLHTGDSDAFLSASELEGFKYNPFDDVFSLCAEPMNSGRTNLIYYKPYSVYTETKQW